MLIRRVTIPYYGIHNSNAISNEWKKMFWLEFRMIIVVVFSANIFNSFVFFFLEYERIESVLKRMTQKVSRFHLHWWIISNSIAFYEHRMIIIIMIIIISIALVFTWIYDFIWPKKRTTGRIESGLSYPRVFSIWRIILIQRNQRNQKKWAPTYTVMHL